MQTAVALGIKKLIVEGDFQKVIKCLEGNMEECPTEIRICTEDCRKLYLDFDILKFKHIRKNKNTTAHAIAKKGIEGGILSLWTSNSPEWLSYY